MNAYLDRLECRTVLGETRGLQGEDEAGAAEVDRITVPLTE